MFNFHSTIKQDFILIIRSDNMAKGIIYLMVTFVPGFVKIGKTGTDNFDTRMRTLEKHGYANVTGLKKNLLLKLMNMMIKRD